MVDGHICWIIVCFSWWQVLWLVSIRLKSWCEQSVVWNSLELIFCERRVLKDASLLQRCCHVGFLIPRLCSDPTYSSPGKKIDTSKLTDTVTQIVIYYIYTHDVLLTVGDKLLFYFFVAYYIYTHDGLAMWIPCEVMVVCGLLASQQHLVARLKNSRAEGRSSQFSRIRFD